MKKIPSELAVGIVLLIALAVGVVFWFDSREIFPSSYVYQQNTGIQDKIETRDIATTEASADTKCSPRYFEGEATIGAWLAEEGDSDGDLKIEIKKEDIQKIPNRKSDAARSHFTLTLIDPTDEVREKIEEASEEKPAPITVRGYADVCSDNPQLSLELAGIAFKKS